MTPLGSQTVDQERAILVTRHDAFDVALPIALSWMPRVHRPRYRHRVVAERLVDHHPMKPPQPILFFRLRLRSELLGGQRDGLGQVLDCRLIIEW